MAASIARGTASGINVVSEARPVKTATPKLPISNPSNRASGMPTGASAHRCRLYHRVRAASGHDGQKNHGSVRVAHESWALRLAGPGGMVTHPSNCN